MKLPKAKIGKVMLAYITIVGMITFPLFIMEEATQVCMFSTWAAKDAGDYETIRNAILFMRKIRETAASINIYLGWIQPISYLAYKNYFHATKFYEDSRLSHILAVSPETLIGVPITTTLHWTEALEIEPGLYGVKAGQIIIPGDPEKLPNPIKASGHISKKGGFYVFHLEKVEGPSGQGAPGLHGPRD